MLQDQGENFGSMLCYMLRGYTINNIIMQLKKTPYEAFTSKRPIVESLITWGCKVTANKPGTRPTTITPHDYDRIFLGYINAMLDLQYYDVHTRTIKYA